MKKLCLLLLIFTILSGTRVQAQDTLPRFSVLNAGNNRIIIGWVNSYTNVRQISIQRSFDSLTNYKTILTVADPTNPQNGYVDGRAASDQMFYRVYIMLASGRYIFTEAKRPAVDTMRKSAGYAGLDRYPVGEPTNNVNPVVTKPRIVGFVPSMYVYTHRDGYVRINLPDNEKPKKYSLKFFEEDDTILFEIKEAKERTFKIDKTNFYHGGWFKFELYEDGELLERHKFYLEREF